MSDDYPEVPEYINDAITSERPSGEALDVLKAAFTWRTIDQDLAELTYDSFADAAGVRSDKRARTMQFALGNRIVVVEIASTTATGRMQPAEAGSVVLRSLGQTIEGEIASDGSFALSGLIAGTARLEVRVDGSAFITDVFTIG